MTATKKTLYETDFVLWAEQTADKLHNFFNSGNMLQMQDHIEDVDWENIISELKCLGRSEKHALESQLVRVIKHLLKCDYQPNRRTSSWESSIAEGRTQLRRLLRTSPSLNRYMEDIFAQCYEDAVKEASAETKIRVEMFSPSCPYSIEQVLED